MIRVDLTGFRPIPESPLGSWIREGQKYDVANEDYCVRARATLVNLSEWTGDDPDDDPLDACWNRTLFVLQRSADDWFPIPFEPTHAREVTP